MKSIEDMTQEEREEIGRKVGGKMADWMKESGDHVAFIVDAITGGNRSITIRQIPDVTDKMSVWFGDEQRGEITLDDLKYLVFLFSSSSETDLGLVFPFDKEGIVTLGSSDTTFKVELRGRDEDKFLLRISEVA